MSQTKNSTENKEESNETGENSCAVVVPIQQTGDIFKLDIDCFEELFEFLPIDDLVSIGKTCKRLQQLAGYCFQRNYASIEKWMNPDGKISDISEKLNLNYFIRNIDRICFKTKESLEMFRNKQSKFVRLKRMAFLFFSMRSADASALTSFQIDCVKEKLNQIEVLRLFYCDIDGDLHRKILKFCTNLKRLIIDGIADGRNDWLSKNYPTLEYCEFHPRYPCREFSELITFIGLNPTIRMFSTDAIFLFLNRTTMLHSKIELDDLAVVLDPSDGYHFHAICEFISDLYDQGVYKRLHLYIFKDLCQDNFDGITILKSVTKLYIGYVKNGPIKLPIFADLKEICIRRSDEISNMVDVASKFQNLERVDLGRCSSTELVLFISLTVKLLKIKVNDLSAGIHYDDNGNILDLVRLNNLRQKLNVSDKLTLYVKENIYLSTKRAMRNTDLSHIVMKRAESYDWNHSFINNFY